MRNTSRRIGGRRILLVGALSSWLVGCMGVQTPVVPTMTPAPTPTPAASRPVSVPNSTPALASSSVSLDGQGFADPAFRSLWQRFDGDVISGKIPRGWFWGQPVPFGAMREPYADAPGGTRLVQYFDKGRMEINDPNADPTSEWYVTSGLLTTELVTGRMQDGANSFKALGPAQIPVTGDLDRPDPKTPWYADYGGERMGPAANRTGQPVTAQLVHGKGEISISPPAEVIDATYDQALGHNIADVFMHYFEHDLAAMGLNWLFVMGHPISEPYWVSANFGGTTRMVLVQLFERRALSYNPSNPSELQVEFTNIGLHYYRWRYNDRSGAVSPMPGVALIDTTRWMRVEKAVKLGS